MKEFNDIHFHDAVLKNISIDWEAKTITIEMSIFINSLNERAKPYCITFRGVSYFLMPHHSPWGDSFFINSAIQNGSVYLFEIQSGDTLHIHADTFELIPQDNAAI